MKAKELDKKFDSGESVVEWLDKSKAVARGISSAGSMSIFRSG